MTDWRSLRGSNFLAPEDLATGPALVTIVEVKGEEMLDDNEKIKKEVAIAITARHRNPETGQAEDLRKTEWVANVVNLTLLEALFGTPQIEQWIGRKALLQQEPCEVPGKYLGQPSVRVAGGPDIDRDLPVEIVLKMKGGKKRRPIHKVLHPTRSGGDNVNLTTGEVGASAATPNPAGATEAAQTVPSAVVADADSGAYWPENADAETPTPEQFGMDAEQAKAHYAEPAQEDPSGITTQQVRILNVNWRKLMDAGWAEEDLLALLEKQTGKVSRKTLTIGEASGFIKALAAEVQDLGTEAGA